MRVAGCLLLVMAAAACGGDDDGTRPADVIDLSGSHELMSYEREGEGVLAPPLATGSLVMTETRYDIEVFLPPAAVPPGLDEEGEYVAEADNEIRLVPDGSGESSAGLYFVDATALEKGTLSLDLTRGEYRIVTYWKKL